MTRKDERGPGAGPIACVMGEIDLVSALGRAGIPCAVAAVPGDPATFSRHAVERVGWFDPWERSEEMLSSLLDWGRAQRARPVLFFNGDHDLLLVSRNRVVLAEVFDFVLADEQLVEDLVDKERFSDLAKKLDLPVPSQVCFDPAQVGPEDIDVDFPVVVKPLTRRDERWRPLAGGGKALHMATRADLERGWAGLQRSGRVIAQTLIPGPESRIESYHVYVDRAGNRRCEFTGRKIRTLPLAYGDTTALETTEAPDVLTLGRDLVERMNLRGVAKFDFKRDPLGNLWLLEVNPRFNLWHHAGAVAGANIPCAVYEDLTGMQRSGCSARAGVTWCHPTRDLKAARLQGISLAAWWQWQRRCEARWGFSLRDPQPFLQGVVGRRISTRLRSR